MPSRINTLLAAMLIGVGACSAPAAAQEHSGSGDSLPEFESLAACAVIYREIATIYADRDAADKAREFRRTATAFSASSLHVAGYQRPDMQSASAFAQRRMQEVTHSLNQSSADNPDGDMGVVEEWLPFCDSLGPRVEKLLDAREARGW